MSTERVDGQRIVDLLASVGITEWRKGVIGLSVGPNPILTVRRYVLDADGRVQVDPEQSDEPLTEELLFGVDWPIDERKTT